MKKDFSKNFSEAKTMKDNLRNSIKEGIFAVASTNMTSNYIIPFALFIGAEKSQVSLLVFLQNLGSTIAQLPGASIVGKMNRKTIWFITFILSRLLWIFVAFLAFLSVDRFLTFSVLIFVIFFLNGIRTPAWSSLMSDIVPEDRRGSFFGKRNMITGATGLIVLFASGWILASFGFSALFALAGIIGLVAVIYFSKIREPPFRGRFVYRHSLNINMKRIFYSKNFYPEFFWFTVYMVLVSFAIALASPFYTVKMLKVLDIGYVNYSVLITIAAIVAIFSQPYWGKLSDRFGDKAVLIITGTMLIFFPALWIFANSLIFLVLIHIYDGFIFSGWAQVTFNFLLATTPMEKRARYIANHTFLNGIGTMMGTLTGGLLVIFFESKPFLDAISWVFLISFLLRLVSFLLLPKIRRIYLDKTDESMHNLMVRSIVSEPAKNVYSFLGYLYDVEWLKNEIRYALQVIWRKILYKIRIATNGRI